MVHWKVSLKHIYFIGFLLVSEAKKEGQSGSVAGSSTGKPEESGKGTEEKHESDSETQNTSCSEESIEDGKPDKKGSWGPVENLKLLDVTINELFSIAENGK